MKIKRLKNVLSDLYLLLKKQPKDTFCFIDSIRYSKMQKKFDIKDERGFSYYGMYIYEAEDQKEDEIVFLTEEEWLTYFELLDLRCEL